MQDIGSCANHRLSHKSCQANHQSCGNFHRNDKENLMCCMSKKFVKEPSPAGREYFDGIYCNR